MRGYGYTQWEIMFRNPLQKQSEAKINTHISTTIYELTESLDILYVGENDEGARFRFY